MVNEMGSLDTKCNRATSANWFMGCLAMNGKRLLSRISYSWLLPGQNWQSAVTGRMRAENLLL